MTTLVFQFNNGGYITVTAPKSTPVKDAIEIARQSMPQGATMFRQVARNYRSGWIK